MIPRDKLEKLQHKCKGQGKENLYHLIGVQGAPPDHRDLRKRLARKRDSWSKMADKAAHLDIVEEAWELLKTPSDKAQYDRFLESLAEPQAPPVSPPRQPWGYEQPPMSPQQPVQPKRRAGLGINAALVLVGLALVALSLLMTGTVPWDVRPPGTTANTAPSDVGTGVARAGRPVVADGANQELTRPSDSSSRGTSPSTGTERSRPAPTRAQEAGPGTAAATTLPPAPGGPPPAGPTTTPEAPAAGPGVESPRPTQAPAATTAAPAPEAAVPEPPVPLPVEEPVQVGGNVAQPRKTWNVQPEYPRMARLRRVQGMVILEVTVDRQGNVSNVEVLRPMEGLDEAAVEAVRRWRYEPTIVNGRPVSVILTETVRFELNN